VSFITAKQVLDLIKPLAVKLQKKDQDIVQAYAMIDEVKDSISDLRNNMDVEFSKIYAEAESLAERVGAVISIPRLAGHQKHRGNIVSENAQQYFRRNVAIPFVDNIKEQLDSRFSVHDRVASSLFDVLPRNVISKNDQELDELVKSLLFWDEDIDTPSSLRCEIGRWKRHWDKKAGSSDESLNLPCINRY
jgi:hypothetical protein